MTLSLAPPGNLCSPGTRRDPSRKGRLLPASEVRHPQKRQVIGIVEVVCTAGIIVKRHSHYGSQILSVELPINILETVSDGIRMRCDYALHSPLAQVG